MGEDEMLVSKTGGARALMRIGELGERGAVGGKTLCTLYEGSIGAEFGAADSGAVGKDDACLLEKRRVSEGRLLLLVIRGGDEVGEVGVGSCLKGGKERSANDFRFEIGVWGVFPPVEGNGTGALIAGRRGGDESGDSICSASVGLREYEGDWAKSVLLAAHAGSPASQSCLSVKEAIKVFEGK